MNKALLIYDGECPMCLRAQAWVRKHVPASKLDLLPCQAPERAERAPQVSYEECMEAMQLIMPDGTRYAGQDSFLHLFPLVEGPWKVLGWLLRAPGVRLASPFVYRWVARHRLQISAFFVRKAPGASCSIDKGCE